MTLVSINFTVTEVGFAPKKNKIIAHQYGTNRGARSDAPEITEAQLPIISILGRSVLDVPTFNTFMESIAKGNTSYGILVNKESNVFEDILGIVDCIMPVENVKFTPAFEKGKRVYFMELNLGFEFDKYDLIFNDIDYEVCESMMKQLIFKTDEEVDIGDI